MATVTKAPSKNGVSKTSPIKNGIPVNTEKLKPVNIEDRVKKINRLGELGKQRFRLLERKTQAEDFEFGSDKMQDHLIISDGHGSSFETTNSRLIAKITDGLKSLLDEAIETVELEILQTTF